jgi:hypothetical protein
MFINIDSSCDYLFLLNLELFVNITLIPHDLLLDISELGLNISIDLLHLILEVIGHSQHLRFKLGDNCLLISLIILLICITLPFEDDNFVF